MSPKLNTKRSIENALKRNRELKLLLRKKILNLSVQKAQNRKRCQDLMCFLYSNWMVEDTMNSRQFVGLSNQFYNKFAQALREIKLMENRKSVSRVLHLICIVTIFSRKLSNFIFVTFNHPLEGKK